MILLEATDFFAETWGGRPNNINPSVYNGYSFECACGKTHIFNSLSVHILRKLPKKRLVLTCPENDGYATCIKLRGLLWFKGFESLFGTEIKEEVDMIDVLEKKLTNDD